MSDVKCPKTGKIIHATRWDALDAIRSLYRAGRGNPDYRAYQCGHHWHIGHSKVSLNKRIRKVLRDGAR